MIREMMLAQTENDKDSEFQMTKKLSKSIKHSVVLYEKPSTIIYTLGDSKNKLSITIQVRNAI